MQRELRERDKRVKALEAEVQSAGDRLSRMQIEAENSRDSSAHAIEVSLKRQMSELESQLDGSKRQTREQADLCEDLTIKVKKLELAQENA